MAETKRERFIRVAERRVNDVLNGYRLLMNLKNANYESTTAMRAELLSAIRRGLDELEACWAGDKPDKEVFRFTRGISNGHDPDDEEVELQN